MSKSIRLSTASADAAATLDRLLENLPVAGRGRPSVFALDRSGEGWCLEFPDGGTCRAPSVADAFYHLESMVYDELLPQETRCYVIHGASVRHRASGATVLLAGPSRCGKSTLSLALVAGGEFDYLSEEATGLTLEGAVVPYPKPFRARDSAERLVSDLAGWAVLDRIGSGQCYVVPPRSVVVDAPCAGAIQVFVVPQFAPGIEAEFTALSRAEALAQLATCTTNRPGFLAARWGRLVALGREMDSWRLRWSNPEVAALRLAALCAERATTVDGS